MAVAGAISGIGPRAGKDHRSALAGAFGDAQDRAAGTAIAPRPDPRPYPCPHLQENQGLLPRPVCRRLRIRLSDRLRLR